MSSTTWSSNPIQLTETVSVDVHVSVEGVTLGESANHTLAADLLLEPDNSEALGIALIVGAHECRKAREAQS
jgi:hypothetical protein